MNSLRKDIRLFVSFLLVYNHQKVVFFASLLEYFKNLVVDLLMFKRGILQKKIWHGSMVGLSAFGIITSGVFGGQTILSASYPGVGPEDPRFVNTYDPDLLNDPILNSLYDTRTNISKKPRSETIEYEVKSGDTISTIAEHFDVSIDTIKWANGLDNKKDTIKPGQKIKILPVSGIAHKVSAGDTLESVAKKYSTEAQGILDFPFNDVPDDFKLKVGQVLIVPEGILPQTPVLPKTRPTSQYLAQGVTSPTFQAPGGGNFIWPTRGILTQYFSWYHPAIDIADRSGPTVIAADGGTVLVAGWLDNSGYGNRVIIDHGNGYSTLYSHFANVYVTAGQRVSRGQAIGQMGTTGRSTGIHLHLEIRYKGIALNPLAILK